jgi:uncharacterized protein YbbK (DUF523 family)
MRHLPTSADVEAWPSFTEDEPCLVLVSACLIGTPCGVDATSYGAPFAHTDRLFTLPNVRVVPFCPEDMAFGTPRSTPDMHGGGGFDVLDGKARVLSATGEDWTDAMVQAAEAMVALAMKHAVRFALLTDISAACGSQVIYDGARALGVHRAGQGVCAALLLRHGVKVLSQRDHRTLDLILNRLDPAHRPDPLARDHHESPWYVDTFGTS